MARLRHAVLVVAALVGLSTTAAIAGTVEEIMAADRAFSRMSEVQGTGPAFIFYSHPDVRIFLRGVEPLIGKDAVVAAFGSEAQKKQDATGERLTWEPTEGFASADGSLGWTNGRWAHRSAPNEKGRRNTLATGYYITLWQKDAAGAWKMIGDMGTKDVPQIADVPKAQ
jgi:hypothetical protein